MSVENYEAALKIIKSMGIGDFEGPKPESLIRKAEAALGVTFPPSYRRFLLDLGCGDIGGFEIFGVIDDNFQNSSVPNGVWLTLNERRNIGLAPGLVIVGEGGDGCYYALDIRPIEVAVEAGVVRLLPDGSLADRVTSSFGEYFLDAVKRVT